MNRSAFPVDTGDGAPLLCLHDVVSRAADFAGLSALGDRFRILGWDAPGFGDEPVADDEPSLGGYAERVLDTLRRAEVGPVHVLGSGWGAMLALEIAARDASAVRSLVLAGGTVGFGERPERAGAAYPPDAAPAGAVGDGYRHAVAMMRSVDLFAQSRALRLPALVLCGDEDRVTGIEESQRVSAAVPNAVFVTINQAGHLPHLDKPQTFRAWLGSFLDIVDHVRGGERA